MLYNQKKDTNKLFACEQSTQHKIYGETSIVETNSICISTLILFITHLLYLNLKRKRILHNH
jgi:hypothetical protein